MDGTPKLGDHSQKSQKASMASLLGLVNAKWQNVLFPQAGANHVVDFSL